MRHIRAIDNAIIHGDDRAALRACAYLIARSRGDQPAGPLVALRKLIIQEQRDRSRPGSPQIGWKRGEFLEFLAAVARRDWAAAAEEWGDLGYYIAQGPEILWKVYRVVTPGWITLAALEKFRKRAVRAWRGSCG